MKADKEKAIAGKSTIFAKSYSLDIALPTTALECSSNVAPINRPISQETFSIEKSALMTDLLDAEKIKLCFDVPLVYVLCIKRQRSRSWYLQLHLQLQ